MQKENEEFQILPYNIDKHAAQVQQIYDQYLIPTYLQRLGIKEDERSRYSEIEDCLAVNAVLNEKFVGYSLVVVDSSGQVKGAQFSYLVDKEVFKRTFVELNRNVVVENQHKESILKYCQHRYEVGKILFDLYEKYDFERALYSESVFLHPDVRGKGLKERLGQGTLSLTNEVILYEGQIPVDVYVEHYGIHGPVIGKTDMRNGFIVHVTRLMSYDLFVIPIAIRLPTKQSADISSKL